MNLQELGSSLDLDDPALLGDLCQGLLKTIVNKLVALSV
jgi:hypothetical protein